MEAKKFSRFEISAIKGTAKTVSPIVLEKEKTLSKINELQEKYNSLCQALEQYEAPIKTFTGGFTTEELVDRIVEETGKLDKNGKPIKVTKYVLKYPDTIVPPMIEESVEVENVDDTEEAPTITVNAGEKSPIDPLIEEVEKNN